MSLMSPALAGGFFTISATWEAPMCLSDIHKHTRETKAPRYQLNNDFKEENESR